MENFYEQVQEVGKLPTREHAQRWTNAVLNTLGFNLDRSTKKALQKSLPDELAKAVGKVFFLAHFRNNELSRDDFLKAIARRSGNTDAQFAYFPTVAVFKAVKGLIGDDLDRKIGDTLAPEIQTLWQR